MPRFKPEKIFAWASFFNDMGSDMVFSVWPAFVTATLGASASFLGFLDGLGDALVALSQFFSGIASDRLGRHKIFVWVGYLGGIAGRVGYALAHTSGALVIPKILDRSGKIREAPRDALVAQAVPERERGKAYGFIRAMDNAGAVVGILFAFTLLQFLHVPIRTLFFIAAIPSVASVCLVWFFIAEPAHGVRAQKRPPLSFRPIFASTNLRKIFLAFLFFGIANFSYSFLLLAARRLGVPVAFLPLLYLTYTAVAAFSSHPFGKLVDRFGPQKIAVAGLELFAAAVLIAAASKGLAAVLLIFLAYGLHKGAWEPSQRALVASLSPTELRATTLGSLQFVLGIAAIPASLLVGILWDVSGGPRLPFLIAATLALASALVIWFLNDGSRAPLPHDEVVGAPTPSLLV